VPHLLESKVSDKKEYCTHRNVLLNNFVPEVMMSLFESTALFSGGSPGKVIYEPEDAHLEYIEKFFSKEESDGLYQVLLNETMWKQSDIIIYGKRHTTPRLTAWYGDEDKSYRFSGNTMHPHPWTPSLKFIKEKVEQESEVKFNSVLLNLYRTGKDSVGWHRDNEKEFGEDPVIASVSFGETRPFQFRHKFRKELKNFSIPLTHGSLLLMKGKTQHFWEHQIPKTAKDVAPRINLTFRIIKTVI
jgi:alkylated DNA repair dioxygenase AlkB